MGLKRSVSLYGACRDENSSCSVSEGQEFLKTFDDFMEKEAGWRLERMAEINVPTWLEDPAPALPS